MMCELWGAKCRPGQIALLRGGQPIEVLNLVLQAIHAPSVLIADQAFLEQLATTDGISGKERLDLRLSRGLAADFAAISQAHGDQPVIVTASALSGDIAVACKLIGGQLEVVGGYALPQTLVESFVVKRLVETLLSCAQRQAAPVIVHDSLHLIDLQALGGAVRIEMGDPGAIKGVDRARSDRRMDEPTLEEVRGHAQFLAMTAKPVLLAMHSFMRGPAAGSILRHWRTKLKELEASDPNDATMVAQALTQLEDLALDQQDTAIKPQLIGPPRAAPAQVVPANQVRALLASAGVVAVMSEGTTENNLPNQGVLQAEDGDVLGVAFNDASANGAASFGGEIKTDMSLIYGKPGQPRSPKKPADGALETFGSGKKNRVATRVGGSERLVSEAEHMAAIAKIVRDVEAAAAIVSQDAIAQAVRKAEASAAVEREQAVAAAVQHAVAAAQEANAVELAAAAQAAEAKAAAAIAAAIEDAEHQAQANSADERRAEIAAAVNKAMAAAELEKNLAVQDAQAAGQRALQAAVAQASRAAEAAADVALARAVENAIARTTALAEQARDQAVAEALETAAIKAEHLRIEAVRYAVSEAQAAGELEKAAAVQHEVALTTSLLEADYQYAIAEALAQAAQAAEISLAEAVATAVAAAHVAAEVARDKAIAQAVAITEGLAEREREDAVNEALARAACESERAMRDAIAAAVAQAEAAAELAQSAAIEQAVAQVTMEAARAQEAAVAQAYCEAELAAEAKAKAHARATSDLKSRADAEFMAALARKRERISKLGLSEIEVEMSQADTAWRGKEMTARCCSLLRAMRQTSLNASGQSTVVETEASRLKDAYDAKLRSALVQTEMRVTGHGGLVTLIFTVNAIGQTEDVRIAKTSGNGQLDAAAAAALKRAVFPAPPMEVGGDIAYTALLHFA